MKYEAFDIEAPGTSRGVDGRSKSLSQAVKETLNAWSEQNPDVRTTKVIMNSHLDSGFPKAFVLIEYEGKLAEKVDAPEADAPIKKGRKEK